MVQNIIQNTLQYHHNTTAKNYVDFFSSHFFSSPFSHFYTRIIIIIWTYQKIKIICNKIYNTRLGTRHYLLTWIFVGEKLHFSVCTHQHPATLQRLTHVNWPFSILCAQFCFHFYRIPKFWRHCIWSQHHIKSSSGSGNGIACKVSLYVSIAMEHTGL